MKTHAPVVMIGLDASEVTLVQQLCDQGVLPTLQGLKQRGCFGVLDGPGTTFAGGVWPTFYTSTEVPWHGLYHDKLWRHPHMRCEVANEQWLPETPFWERLDPRQYRIAVLDVPMTVRRAKSLNGLQLSGWGSHDTIVQGCWPPNLWHDLTKTFGPPLMPVEWWGPQSAKALLQLRQTLLRTTEQMADISEALLARQAWDLFLVVFSATHRGGHYLWDLSQIEPNRLTPEHRSVLEGALIDIYQACDRAVARLIAKAPQGATIMVFAVHGMDRNPGWSDRCTEILSRIQSHNQDIPAHAGVFYTLKQVLPRQLVRQVTSRLPSRLRQRLVGLWSANMFDWQTTRYLTLPMDRAGYVRVNLRGREPQGIVEPGREYEAICQELQAAFRSFRDMQTGAAIVDHVYRVDDLAPPDAPYRELLPDLIIVWNDTLPIPCRGIRSETYGEIRWPDAGRLPSGRSGNHRSRGWFVAVGKDLPPATVITGQRTVDLVPTVYQWLGAEPPQAFQGRPICPAP